MSRNLVNQSLLRALSSKRPSAGVLHHSAGFIFITFIPALMGGAALLALGARGKLGYYQLHIRKTSTATPTALEANRGTTIRTFMQSLGLTTPAEEARWRLDYAKAGSFLATIRTVIGELPEISHD